MGKRSNWQEFQTILNQHHIKKLYHFTDKENLESIIKNGGLYSWADCEEKGIVITKPGGGGPSRDLDKRHGLEHYVRLSFTKRHPMMFVAQEDGRINDPVILEINPEILFEEDTLFSDKNAASNGAHVGGTLDDFKMIHFKSVKAKKHFDLEESERPYFQAEILVKSFLPLYYITNIESLNIPIKNYFIDEKTLTTKVTYEDRKNGLSDKYDVLYSSDGIRLLECQNEDLRDYQIKPGTIVVCNEAFYIRPENPMDPYQNNVSNLTSVIIPNSIISIGNHAFYDCRKLANINIPDSVIKIGKCAFYCCNNMTNVIIPKSVNSIGLYAFSGCSRLSCLIVDEGNPVYDSRNNCNAIIETASNKLICGNKDTIIPDTVSAIEIGAFSCCSSLESVVIPDSVTEIGDAAFEKCSNLVKVVIPNSVTRIGNCAFNECKNLTSIIIGNSVTEIGDWAFEGCKNLTSITIGNSVTEIGNNAFEGCSNLVEVVISNSVKRIGRRAFRGCSNLTSITIGDSVTEIGAYAFEECSNLVKVVISNSVKRIGDWAFEGCKNLTSITIGNSVTEIGNNAFKGCSNLVKVVISNSVKRIGDWAFEGCKNLTSITIGNSVTEIGNNAFKGCSSLKSIVIPDSVTEIGVDAFDGCGELANLNIPNSVISIGSGALDDTAWYNNQPDGVVYAGKVAYKYKGDMPNNTTIVLENDTLSISASAFKGCCGLENISIPDSVILIGSAAFRDTTWFKKQTEGLVYAGKVAYRYKGFMPEETILFIKEGTPSITNFAFGFTIDELTGCMGLTGISIPKSVTKIGKDLFSGCPFLMSILIDSDNPIYDSRKNCNAIIETATNSLIVGCNSTIIPDSIVSIGDYAFSGFKRLNHIKIPKSVTRIGNYAFRNCRYLTSIEISDSIVSIGNNAFDGCDKLSEIIIPKGSLEKFQRLFGRYGVKKFIEVEEND